MEDYCAHNWSLLGLNYVSGQKSLLWGPRKVWRIKHSVYLPRQVSNFSQAKSLIFLVWDVKETAGASLLTGIRNEMNWSPSFFGCWCKVQNNLISSAPRFWRGCICHPLLSGFSLAPYLLGQEPKHAVSVCIFLLFPKAFVPPCSLPSHLYHAFISSLPLSVSDKPRNSNVSLPPSVLNPVLTLNSQL